MKYKLYERGVDELNWIYVIDEDRYPVLEIALSDGLKLEKYSIHFFNRDEMVSFNCRVTPENFDILKAQFDSYDRVLSYLTEHYFEAFL